MAAIDFKALLLEERRKQREGRAEATQATPQAVNIAPQQPIPDPHAFAFPAYSIAARPVINLADFSVGSIDCVAYCPSFVTRSEARAIVDMVYAVPRSNSRWVQLRGRALQCWGGTPPEPRRTELAPKPFEAEPLPEWLARLCDSLAECGVFPAAAPPNHVLINEYHAGEGILPHTDGPAYDARTATLSLSVGDNEEAIADEAEERCGSGGAARRVAFGAVMTFTPRQLTSEVGIRPAPLPACEVALRPQSLVVFEGSAYRDHTHAIDAISAAGGLCHDIVGAKAPLVNTKAAGVAHGDFLRRPSVRISLTFRRITPSPWP